MPDTPLRYLAMLEHIPPRPRKVTARGLRERLHAAGFEVTTRTVQRDLQRLAVLFPLVSDEPVKPTGWSWSGPVRDLPTMNLHTALTFVLAQRFLDRLLPPETLSYLAPHVARAEAVLGEAGGRGLQAWPRKVRVLARGPRLVPAPVAPEVIEVVYGALLEGRRIEARYRPRGEGAREYQVNPLGLVHREAVAYLVATLWDYQDVVHLALHRFEQAVPLEERSRIPADFDLDAHIASEAFGYPEGAGRRIRLAALFDADAAWHLQETALSPEQSLAEQPDGRVLLRAPVRETAELRWWLLGFGDQVEVVAPKRLRAHLAATARRTCARYADES